MTKQKSGESMPTRRKAAAALALGAPVTVAAQTGAGGTAMPLGAFSVSLAVKDIAASKAFYEKLGFRVFMGDASKKWLMLRSGATVIGLFQGMFDKNILTFNPGWDQNAQKLASFQDVRELQRQLKSRGVKPSSEVDEKATGPGSFVVVDPDGNAILFDQHV